MTTDQRIQRLPHRPPFLFLTGLDVLEPGIRGAGRWRVDGTESFLQGHFPSAPIVPEVLIAEALAQLAGLVAEGGGEGRLAHVNVTFAARVHPPAVIDLVATAQRSIEGLWLFDVGARARGDEVACGTLSLAFGGGDR